jgi:hypothetical protein
MQEIAKEFHRHHHKSRQLSKIYKILWTFSKISDIELIGIQIYDKSLGARGRILDLPVHSTHSADTIPNEN